MLIRIAAALIAPALIAAFYALCVVPAMNAAAAALNAATNPAAINGELN